MKLAILFPGIGYHTDKPLLYYSKKILKNMDYEIKEIHFENLDFDLNKSKDEAYKHTLPADAVEEEGNDHTATVTVRADSKIGRASCRERV